jgi:hypothetical protein
MAPHPPRFWNRARRTIDESAAVVVGVTDEMKNLRAEAGDG